MTDTKKIAERGQTEIRVPSHKNKLLEQALQVINANQEIKTLWQITNVNAMDRLRWADHGSVHFQIVANIALRIARILNKKGIEMSVTKNFGLSYDHAELIVLLGSLFHDLGMSINRDGHEEFSLLIANNLMRENLTFLPIHERTIVTSEVLHAIINHRDDGNPLTIEAGIVMIADALDMSQGRIKLAFEDAEPNIHSISAYAIDSVKIEEGEEKPISIDILMNNSAGLFQIDDLLKSKIKGSGLGEFIQVKALVEGESEKKILTEFTLK